MKALRILGWIFVPYVMIFVSWKGLRGVGKTFGIIWAVLGALIVIGNLNKDNTVNKSVPVTATEQKQEVKKDEAKPTIPTPAPVETTKPTPAPTPTPAPKNKETLSKAEFDAIQIGMTYDEATKIVGGPGEVISESGKKGGSGLDIHTVMYQYKGEGSLGANANMMFQDEKLVNKAQMGLK